MLLGYNTNGWAHHRLEDALALLAEIGYRSVAITLDHGALDPFDRRLGRQLVRVGALLERHGLRSVIETGARFLLDPREKHEPTLVSPQAARRRRRVAFLKRAVDIAQRLGSDCVSLWSGVVRDGADEAAALARLTEGLAPVLDHARRCGVPLGFEPEPGMLIDTVARYEQLVARLAAPDLMLTLDVGHLHCLGEPLEETIRRVGPRIVNVHLEDMRRGVHEHLMFGEGDLDVPAALAALRAAAYRGAVHVELSRHSHEAPLAARRAYGLLAPLVEAAV